MGWPGVGGFSASLSEEMSSASPNRSSAAGFFAGEGERTRECYGWAMSLKLAVDDVYSRHLGGGGGGGAVNRRPTKRATYLRHGPRVLDQERDMNIFYNRIYTP